MKKIIIAVVTLMLLAGAAAGYYFFVYQNEGSGDAAVSEPIVKPSAGQEKPDTELSETEQQEPEYQVRKRYVTENGVEVVNEPNGQYVEDRLYKGEEVDTYEESSSFTRITPYIVLEEGGEEIANWVNSNKLADEKPTISSKETDEMIEGLIGGSDDYKTYKEIMHQHTEALIKSGRCKHEEFIELDGWMRSINYSGRDVYFVYCGGLNVNNKVYLDTNQSKILN
ncbi:hypothetical protein [Vibrio maerlii]|uniref:hypothetical protein n=1 Tax=Vibrio maerlii TaxID=2231648 RepID=UPI000E3D62B1|nr:hypothetical protein [Vibrio maerlii]